MSTAGWFSKFDVSFVRDLPPKLTFVTLVCPFSASLPVPFSCKITPRFPEAMAILDEERELRDQS